MTEWPPLRDVDPTSAHWATLLYQYVANLESILTLIDEVLPLLKQVEEQEMLESGASTYALMGLNQASEVMSQVAAFHRGELNEEELTPDDLEQFQQTVEQLKAFSEQVEQRFPGLTATDLTPEMVVRLLGDQTNEEGLPGLLKAVGLEPSRPSNTALLRFWDVQFPVNRRQMLLNTSLINLITLFESLLSDILRAYYTTYPGAVPGDDLRFTFKELKAFGSFDQALTAVIDHEIDGFMRKSIEDWRAFFKRAIKLDLGEGSIHWPEFAELYQRRHVVVHNSSRASRQYLTNVLPEQRVGVTLHSTLTVSPEYLHRSVETLLAMGIRLINSMWSKIDSKTPEIRQGFLDMAALRMLKTRRWRATNLFLQDFLTTEKQIRSSDRLNAQINLWLSQKQLNGLDSIHKELEAFDHSSVKDRYSAQIYALLNDLEQFMVVYPTSSISLEEMMFFPVYSGLLEHPGFAEAMGLNVESVQENSSDIDTSTSLQEEGLND